MRAKEPPRDSPVPYVADARALALELAGLTTAYQIDPTALGLVIERGETALRRVGAWLTIRSSNGMGQPAWSDPTWSQAILTDRRLLARLASGDVISLWWAGLAGLTVDLADGHVILDLGDGTQRGIRSDHLASIAVAAVFALYGPHGLAVHPGLDALRLHPNAAATVA